MLKLYLGVFFAVFFGMHLSANQQSEVTMKFTSSAFKNGEPIPAKYTCKGDDVSPPLTIADAPKNVQSFALIMDDPDAPGGTFDHWIAWNIPATTQTLPEKAKIPNQGNNHFQKKGYGGPCPPPGKPHRYYFKIYALDTMLNLPDGVTKAQLEKAMAGHILAKAETMGTFQR